jgi:hypothetical protein
MKKSITCHTNIKIAPAFHFMNNRLVSFYAAMGLHLCLTDVNQSIFVFYSSYNSLSKWGSDTLYWLPKRLCEKWILSCLVLLTRVPAFISVVSSYVCMCSDGQWGSGVVASAPASCSGGLGPRVWFSLLKFYFFPSSVCPDKVWNSMLNYVTTAYFYVFSNS